MAGRRSRDHSRQRSYLSWRCLPFAAAGRLGVLRSPLVTNALAAIAIGANLKLVNPDRASVMAEQAQSLLAQATPPGVTGTVRHLDSTETELDTPERLQRTPVNHATMESGGYWPALWWNAEWHPAFSP